LAGLYGLSAVVTEDAPLPPAPRPLIGTGQIHGASTMVAIGIIFGFLAIYAILNKIEFGSFD
jgi:hypothetical protein